MPKVKRTMRQPLPTKNISITLRGDTHAWLLKEAERRNLKISTTINVVLDENAKTLKEVELLEQLLYLHKKNK